jgi:hypothetical protein
MKYIFEATVIDDPLINAKVGNKSIKRLEKPDSNFTASPIKSHKKEGIWEEV